MFDFVQSEKLRLKCRKKCRNNIINFPDQDLGTLYIYIYILQHSIPLLSALHDDGNEIFKVWQFQI